MLKANRKYLWLFLIFTFAFVYRMLLMLWEGYPPGADIGLHNSVIYSITGSGNTDFLYNFYHIGGGLSLTFPGYHIFTASVTSMTGLPEYLAHAAVVSLFSSLIVLCTFLITKKIWSSSAALIAAFLAAVSRFDIEMLMWAGYPNVITLLLIPLTFYFYLQKDRFTTVHFYASTSILVGSLFLTHSLSAGIFVAITFGVVLFVLISPKKFRASRKTALYWLLPVVIGAVLVSPFLVQAVPAYLSNSAYLNGSVGSNDIESATLSARVLPLWIVLPLFGIIPAFLLFSKKYYKRFLVLPTFLLSVWVFVSLILTQGYLLKIPFDYNRFLYFVILPVTVFMAVLIDHGSGFFAKIIDTYRTLTHQAQTTKQTVHKKTAHISAALTRKNLYYIFATFFLLFSFLALPIFMGPTYNFGTSIQGFYQTMNQPLWDAMQWAKQNTSTNAVFVSDALYGWWLGGFAQRQTLSAVDPQYLSLNREVDNATFARNMLDTDYLIDNGLVQVRDDGGYIARHNPEILVVQNWTYYPHSFFTFDSEHIRIEYQINGSTQPTVKLNQLSVKNMRLERHRDHEEIIVTQGNDYFNYTRSTTVYGGMSFVNLTTTLTSTVPGVTFSRVHIDVDTNGIQISYGDDKVTVGSVDIGTKAFGQLIFHTTPDDTDIITIDDIIVKRVMLTYALADKAQGQIQISAGAYSASNNPSYYSDQTSLDNYFLPILVSNLSSNDKPLNSTFVDFDYRQQIQNRKVSFIAVRAPFAVDAKFHNDPLFSPAFINGEVTIYKVNGELSQNR